MAFRKILCPVDFSEGSREALHVAAELARKSQSVLVLAHVLESRLWLAGYVASWPSDVVVEAKASAEASLAAWKADAQHVGASEVKAALVDGVPWVAIVAAASADPAIDLIVMGTHGRTGIARALVGSVAERVVRYAPCAVMVVRQHSSAS